MSSRRQYRIELNVYEDEKIIHAASETIHTESIATHISPIVDKLLKQMKFLVIKDNHGC